MDHKIWKTCSRAIVLDRPLVMGILNVTPDSFYDGGRFDALDAALRHAEQLMAEGADLLDIGGESTRPGGGRVDAAVEVERVIPVIRQLVKRLDAPISVDTTKIIVASEALDAGAQIINDISGLRWEPGLADLAGRWGAGLVLMHSRGDFETMHSQPPVDDIAGAVITDLTRSVGAAKERGVADEQIVLDVGIGFGKSVERPFCVYMMSLLHGRR